MKKRYFYGIYGIQFIFHGEWADPEIIWHGKSFNYYDVENPLWETYSNEPQTLEFGKWVKKNANLAREILSNLQ